MASSFRDNEYLNMDFFRTPDENFGILLEAAVMYDRRVAARSEGSDTAEISEERQHLYPNLLFIITGKDDVVLVSEHNDIFAVSVFDLEPSILSMKVKDLRRRCMRRKSNG